MPDGGIRVEVKGLNELRRDIRQVRDKEAGKALRRAHYATGKKVATRAREMSPRRTGAFAKSIKPRATQESARVKLGVIYGPPIHWGWPARKIEPQPVIYDAIGELAGEIRRDLQDEIARIMEGLDSG